MKRTLVLFLTVLALSSATMAGLTNHFDQDTVIKPRRVQGPSGSFLGVELNEVTGETVQRLKLREQRGALIEGVTSGSSAAQAGLQKNDVIVEWDGQPIESARELSRHIRETPAGRAVRLGVMRDGREMEINVTMGERAAFATRARVARPVITAPRARPFVRVSPGLRDRGRLGVELQSMTPQLAEYFGLSKRTGALVVFVFADSPASKAGLKAGDVILSAGGQNVETPIDLRRVLTEKPEGALEIKIVRDKQERTLTVQVEKGARSFLLDDNFGELGIRASIEPMVIDVPQVVVDPIEIRIPAIKLAPAVVSVPKINIAPMDIQVPKINIAPMDIQVPKFNIAPVDIQVPKINITPMDIKVPRIQVTPMSIPQVKIDLAPMKIDIPKISLPELNIVVVPRRVWL